MTLLPISAATLPRMLIVDDDPSHLEMMQCVMAQEFSLPHESVLLGENTTAALSLFDRHRKTLQAVVTDTIMPWGRDIPKDVSPDVVERMLRGGVWLYDHIRERTSDLPIVMMSNSYWPDIEMRVGADPKSKFFL